MKVTIHVQATLNSTQECHEWQQGDWQGLAPEIKIIRETGEGMSLRNVSQSLVLKFKKKIGLELNILQKLWLENRM